MIALLEVIHQSITEHQRPLANIQFDSVTGVLLGGVVSEGGGHWFVAYEPIIGAYGGVSAPSVPVPQLDTRKSASMVKPQYSPSS